MFVFVAAALAATQIGWPCQRLNWGWRNVWSTCSINSYAPVTPSATVGSFGGYVETPSSIPTNFRFTTTANVPSTQLASSGIFTPGLGTAAVPAMLCSYAPNTGAGLTANLRNRCRRSIDAYTALVKTCGLGAGLTTRLPNSLTPDWAPNVGHAPHVSNVQGLGANAMFCLLPAGTTATPSLLGTPSNTCPGLLGWFTVVFNACGFTNAPGLSGGPTSTTWQAPATPAFIPVYTPLGAPGFAAGVGVTAAVVGSGVAAPGTRVGVFCQDYSIPAGSPAMNPSSPATGQSVPSAWNQSGMAFRTSRCRKALDQFGRTANRCHTSTATTPAGPAQAGGYGDPLRLLAVGSGAVPANAANGPVSPNGFNVWAPACN